MFRGAGYRASSFELMPDGSAVQRLYRDAAPRRGGRNNGVVRDISRRARGGEGTRFETKDQVTPSLKKSVDGQAGLMLI